MFFRRIFGKKPKVPAKAPEVREFTLDSLEDEIKNLKKRRLESIKEIAGQKIDEISKLCENLNKSAKALAEAEATEFVHPGLEKTAHEARRLFVHKVTRATEELKRPAELTWQGLLSFHAALSRALKLMIDAGIAHGRRASVLFRQPMQNTRRLIRMLHTSATELDGIIERGTDEIKELDEISLKITDQKGFLQRLTHLRAQEQSFGSRIEDLKNFIKMKGAELDQLSSSPESKRLESLRRELDQIERKIVELGNEAARAISDLGRPFRKMRKLTLSAEHPLDKEKAKMLELCIDEPFNAFRSDEKDLPVLTALLRDLADRIETGEVKLDPRERQKKLEQIHRMLDGGLLRLKTKYVELMAERDAKKRDLETSPIPEEKAELERALDFNRSELMKTQSKLSETSKALEKTKREIEQNKLELESLAKKILGPELKII